MSQWTEFILSFSLGTKHVGEKNQQESIAGRDVVDWKRLYC